MYKYKIVDKAENATLNLFIQKVSESFKNIQEGALKYSSLKNRIRIIQRHRSLLCVIISIKNDCVYKIRKIIWQMKYNYYENIIL